MQTCKSFGACILAVPALARRGILFITLLGPGLSTSTSTLAKNSSAGPKESRNNSTSYKNKQACQQQRPFPWTCDSLQLLPKDNIINNIVVILREAILSPWHKKEIFIPLNKVSQDLRSFSFLSNMAEIVLKANTKTILTC